MSVVSDVPIEVYEHSVVQGDVLSTEKIEDDTTHRSAVLVACSCIFIGLGVLAVFLVFRSSGDQKGANTGDVSEGYIVPPGPGGRIPDPVPLTATAGTQPLSTSIRAGVTTTPAITTPTTTTRRPLNLTKTFACTISGEMPLGFVFPPDGMCEVIFFTGLYAYAKHMINDSLTPEVQYFAEHSKAHTNRTQYGMGFSVLNLTEATTAVRDARDGLSPVALERLNFFAEHKCNNYAIYDMEGLSLFTNAPTIGGASYLANIGDIFRALLEFHKKHQQPTPFFAIAYIISEENVENHINEITQFMEADITLGIVKYWFVLSHYPFVEYLEATGCFVETPQVLYHPPQGRSYPYKGVQMIDAWIDFYHFDHSSAFDAIQQTLTVSLRSVFKVPMYPDNDNPAIGNYTWFLECALRENRNSTAFPNGWYPPGFIRTTTFAEIYNDPVYGRNIDCTQDHINKGCITFDKSRNRTITWDDETSLRTKVCAIKSNITYLFGLTVYDIDQDDWDYSFPQYSKYGPYSKLRMLYQVYKYITTDFIVPEHEPICRAIEPQKISLEDFRKIKSWPDEGV